MMHYSCFDFVLRSTVDLPELTAVASLVGLPTVDVRIGRVPDPARGASVAAHGLYVATDVAVLDVPGVARYHIGGGSEIVIEPNAGSPDRSWRLFLLGSALGILCLQRGLMLLHANAVAIGRQAAGFAGPSGAGKSTLAAHFVRRGYRVLCDDVCAIAFDTVGKPHILPGLPRLKLWGDAARAYGHDPCILDRVVDGADKYHVPLVVPETRESLPFTRLYVLDRAGEGDGTIVRLRGIDAMTSVMANSYRAEYRAPMGLRQHHFIQCEALLAQVEVYRATRRWGYDVFDEQAARLERHLAAGGASGRPKRDNGATTPGRFE